MSKTAVWFGVAALLLLSQAAVIFAQNDTSTSGGSGAAAPFVASDNLKSFTTEILQGAVKNISDSITAGSVDSAAFWWANDSLAIVQNLTLNVDQIISFYRLLFPSGASASQSGASPVEAGNFTVLSNRFVLEFGGKYNSPNGSGLIMRIWRFQARPQPEGSGAAPSGPIVLAANPDSADAIRQAGVFRIYREAITGPVAPQGQESQLNQFLQQLSQQLSSGQQ